MDFTNVIKCRCICRTFLLWGDITPYVCIPDFSSPLLPHDFVYCSTVDTFFVYFYLHYFQLFVGNLNNSEVISNSSFAPFLTRHVKFCPQRWHNQIALRVELYGCKAEGNSF